MGNHLQFQWAAAVRSSGSEILDSRHSWRTETNELPYLLLVNSTEFKTSTTNEHCQKTRRWPAKISHVAEFLRKEAGENHQVRPRRAANAGRP